MVVNIIISYIYKESEQNAAIRCGHRLLRL